MTARNAWSPQSETVCERCQGAWDSVLHAICEAKLRLQERADGWRHDVRIRPEIRALLKREEEPR